MSTCCSTMDDKLWYARPRWYKAIKTITLKTISLLKNITALVKHWPIQKITEGLDKTYVSFLFLMTPKQSQTTVYGQRTLVSKGDHKKLASQVASQGDQVMIVQFVIQKSENNPWNLLFAVDHNTGKHFDDKKRGSSFLKKKWVMAPISLCSKQRWRYHCYTQVLCSHKVAIGKKWHINTAFSQV